MIFEFEATLVIQKHWFYGYAFVRIKLKNIETAERGGVLVLLADGFSNKPYFKAACFFCARCGSYLFPAERIQPLDERYGECGRRTKACLPWQLGKTAYLNAVFDPDVKEGFAYAVVFKFFWMLDALTYGVADRHPLAGSSRYCDVHIFVYRARQHPPRALFIKGREVGAAAGKANSKRCTNDDHILKNMRWVWERY